MSAGNSFCLVKDEPPQPLNDDIRSGRKSPFISNRAWPKALRTRSASKDRISSRQGALQGSIEQIKTFQERKQIPVVNQQHQQQQQQQQQQKNPPRQQFVRRNVSDSEDSVARRNDEVNRNVPLPRSQSVLHLAAQNSALDQRGRPKGILKTSNINNNNSSGGALRVKERISSYHHSIQEDKTKHQTTLPWNSRVCREDPPQDSLIRKTASSPCLFIKKSSVKIKTGKTPVKLFGTITDVGNLIEDSLLKVKHHKESNFTDAGAAEPDPRRSEIFSGNSRSRSEEQDASSNDAATTSAMDQSVRCSTEATESENNNISIIPTLSFSNTSQDTLNNVNNGQRMHQPGSHTINSGINDHLRSRYSFSPPSSSSAPPHQRYRSEPRDSQASSGASAEYWSSMIVSAPVLRTSESVSESSLLDAASVTRNTAALNNSNTLCYVEQKPDTFCTQENISGKENICVGGKEIISMISDGEEGVTGARGASEQETGVKQRISNNPEHFNSSEDEEISKELSSILTNRGAETTSVLRPRFLTNLRKYNPGASHHPSWRPPTHQTPPRNKLLQMIP